MDEISTLYFKLFGKPLNAIIDPHFDKNSHLDGGLIIENGVVRGHIDPRGEPGAMGYPGKTITDLKMPKLL